MADVKISALPDSTNVVATDQVPIIRSGVNYRSAMSYIRTYIESFLGALAFLNTITVSFLSDATANAKSFLQAADYAAMRVLLGTVATIPQNRYVGNSVNYYVIPGVGAVVTTTTKVLTANRIQYEPFIVETTTTFDQMIVEVTAAGTAGQVLRMAIYDMDIDGQPTTRKVDAGTVAVDSLGIKTASITLTLNPGRYLKAYISDSTATLRAYRAGGRLTTGFDVALGTSACLAGLRVAGAGTSLPDPGTAWNATTNLSSGFDHALLLRVSVP